MTKRQIRIGRSRRMASINLLLAGILLLGVSGLGVIGLGVSAAAAQVAVPQQTQSRTDVEPMTPEVRAVLSRFGSFAQSNLYGEVWIPKVTPQGWHPYPPCHWVKAKRWGLYFDDQTEWGQIVHHYGRWFHDDRLGWAWTSGADFSPGWVAWRSNPQWTGWAPLPPDGNPAARDPDAMSGEDIWLFQETPRLVAECQAGSIAPAARVAALVEETPFVRRMVVVDDMLVFVVPKWIVGPFIDIKVVAKPWSFLAMTKVVSTWNWVWHHTALASAKTICIAKKPAKL